MKWLQLVRAELRKLTTTNMPWGFLAVLVVVAATTATAILIGTDADGTKGFIATSEDQLSLFAFGGNAMMIAGLFGAIAAAREYGHGTVVPTFLSSPRRHQATLAQLTAIALGGGLLGMIGTGLTVGMGAIALPFVDFGLMLSAGAVTQLLGASVLAGAAGAVLGAGAGAVVRNTGGAVVAAVLLLFIAPPLVVQLASGAISWVPATLVSVISGVGDGPALPAAVAALAAWGVIPAAIGVVAVVRRDVV